MIKLKPMGKKLLLLRDETEKVSKGGIIYAEVREYLENKGEVLEVGPEVEGLSPGDRVIHETYTGTPIKFGGKSYLLLEESNIMALLGEEESESPEN